VYAPATLAPVVMGASRQHAGWRYSKRRRTVFLTASHEIARVVEGTQKGTLGGEGGIRTHDTLAGMPHFECGAIDHSATSPARVVRGREPSGGGAWLQQGQDAALPAVRALNR
jgi:hypothetical protein